MKSFILLILLFFAINLFGKTESQNYATPNYPFIHYGVEEGLPQSIISNIIEDSYGFIWMTTNEGLVKFDGHTFTVYNQETGFPFRLVTGIAEKEPGVIWVATYSIGIWRIHGQKVERINFAPTQTKLQINYMSATGDGEILIATEGSGLYVVKPDTVLHFGTVEKNGVISGPVLSGAKDYSGRYWIGTYESGLLVMDEKGKLVRRFTVDDGLPSNDVRSILILPSGKVWVGTSKGLFTWPDRSISNHFNSNFKEVFISQIYSNDKKNIWINANTNPGGVFHFHNNRLEEIINGFQGIYSKCTYINQAGVLFLGTYRGVFVFPDRNFQNYGSKNGLNDVYIRAIFKDPSGTLWVSTKNDGLYFYKQGHFYRADEINQKLQGTIVYSFANYHDELWLGTNHGLCIIRNGKVIQNKLTDFFKDVFIRRFVADEDENLYIVTFHKLYLYADQQLKDLTYNLSQKDYSLWGLGNDKKTNRLWLGTNLSGLWYLQDTTWVPFFTKDSIKNYFAVKKDKFGNLYFATSKGLLEWDGTRMKMVLDLNLTIWDVLPIDEGNIWLMTSRGLYHYNNHILRVFNHKTGLISSEFNMGAVFVDKDSSLWFGGVEGLVHYKRKIIYPEIKPELLITKIATKDSVYEYPFNDNIILSPKEKEIKIHYTAIDYHNSFVHQFAYYLEGFSQDTLLANDQYVVNYTNLSDGFYNFHVMIKSPYSGKILSSKNIHFRILKPWWKSAWFLFFATALLFFTVYSVVRWRIIILKNKNILLEKRIEDRTRDIQLSYKLLKSEVEERKKAQNNLKEEREQLAITLKSIADGVIRTEANGKILFMNYAAEKISGVPENMAKGKSINEVFHLFEETSEERIRLPEYIHNESLGKERVTSFTANLKGPHAKEEKIVALSWSAIEKDDRQTVGYVWVIRDIGTERKLENEILKSQKLESIGLLAGGIAHDFNNFLSGILGNAQLAQLTYQQNKNIEKYLASIEEATKNASHLTQQLLTFAKGGQPLKEIISLKSLVTDSVEFALRGSNVNKQIKIEEGLWAVEADKGQITQVINNMVINAVQAMPSGGDLYIDVQNVFVEKHTGAGNESYNINPGYYVRMIFRDTGIGIPKENLTRIFDPYFTTKQKGSGLGLATSYAIIEKHNGYIFVDSKLGEGTEFTIYLPASPDSTLNKRTESTKLKKWSGKRVLVMDDELYIRELIGNFLELLGFKVHFAEHGEQAIDEYTKALNKKQAYDLVIMDLTVRGGMGGKEAVTKILEIDPKARVIVASGYSTDSVLAKYEEFGFVGRLSKPFTLESLNEVITQILD